MKKSLIQHGTAFFAVAILFGIIFSVEGKIIYQDDFSGDFGTSISGLPPDIRPGSETWYQYRAVWYASGTKYGSSYGQVTLPFIPESGKLYEVSGLVDATNTVIGIGFNPNFNTGDEPAPWVCVDPDYTAANAIRGYLGAWTKDLCYSTGPVDPGYVAVALQLDTRPEKWTAEFFYNGVSLGEPTAYSTNPDITRVGVTSYRGGGNDINYFSLEDISPPTGTVLLIN